MRIMKASNNNIQSMTWSVKNHFNSLRFMMYGCLNGLPMTSLPLTGMFSTGRHNDCNSWDYFHIRNICGISTMLPLKHTIFFLDRGFTQSMIHNFTYAITLLPCIATVKEFMDTTATHSTYLEDELGDISEIERLLLFRQREQTNKSRRKSKKLRIFYIYFHILLLLFHIISFAFHIISFFLYII